MFRSFEEQEDAPRDINRFEQAWLIGWILSAVVAIGMFDYSAMIIGPIRAVLVNVVLFGISIVLMGYASRRRSNVARWLLIPFTLLIFFYDLSHVTELRDRGAVAYLAVGRITLMVTAIYFLFTPGSRAWFAGRPLPPGAADEDWS